MTPEHLALSQNVDLLFRARRDGRQDPVGKTVAIDGMYHWIPAIEETTAACWGEKIEGRRVRPGVEGIGVRPDHISKMRTRWHVALLALTEPTHFRRCMTRLEAREADDCTAQLARLDDLLLKRRRLPHAARILGVPAGVACRMLTHRMLGRPLEFNRAPAPADVLRTGAYLDRLQTRLAVWRASHSVDLAIAEYEAAQRAEAADRAKRDALHDECVELDGDLLAEAFP